MGERGVVSDGPLHHSAFRSDRTVVQCYAAATVTLIPWVTRQLRSKYNQRIDIRPPVNNVLSSWFPSTTTGYGRKI